MLNQILCLVVIGVLIISIMPFAISAAPASNSLNIFPPDSKPYGLSYSEHTHNYWKWLLHINKDDSPRNDRTGERCATGQLNTNSSVFYLVQNDGGTPPRTCKVPLGKGLFIPVSQVEISDKEEPGKSVVELTTDAKGDQNDVVVNSLNLKIDGRDYKYDILTKYRTLTEPFVVMYADNGLYGVVVGGPSKVVADGWYIITDPLTKGNHTIEFRNSQLCSEPGCTTPLTAQDSKYNIITE